MWTISLYTRKTNTNTNTHTHIYIYISVCVWYPYLAWLSDIPFFHNPTCWTWCHTWPVLIPAGDPELKAALDEISDWVKEGQDRDVQDSNVWGTSWVKRVKLAQCGTLQKERNHPQVSAKGGDQKSEVGAQICTHSFGIFLWSHLTLWPTNIAMDHGPIILDFHTTTMILHSHVVFFPEATRNMEQLDLL